MSKNDPLKDEMETLALALAKDLAMDNVAPKDRLDGLKALTGYYAATRKIKRGEQEEDPESFSFGRVAAQLKAVS